QAVAFSRHPYAQGVIGSKEEIKLMTRDGLYAHYRRHYAPNNAYLIVAGDAPATELLDRAAAAFGSLDAEAPIEPPKAPEPPQYGERRVIVRRAGGALPIIQIGHKAPRAADPRAPALSALAVTLAGATAGGGEAASGRSSRLYRALVDTGLATSVDASFNLMKDPYLFVAEAHLGQGVTHDRVERVILDEMDKVARTALTDEEFGRVRRQMLSASAFMTDTVTWRAFRFGQLLATGAATSLGEWYDRLAAVGAAARLDVGSHEATFSAQSLGSDLDVLLELMADAVLRPAFADKEVELVRQQTVAQIEEDAKNTRAVAESAWRELVYPKG